MPLMFLEARPCLIIRCSDYFVPKIIGMKIAPDTVQASFSLLLSKRVGKKQYHDSSCNVAAPKSSNAFSLHCRASQFHQCDSDFKL